MKHQVLIAAPGRDVEAVLAAQALHKAAREAGLALDVTVASEGMESPAAAPALFVGAGRPCARQRCGPGALA
jgi:PTS system fructose-specific IIC component